MPWGARNSGAPTVPVAGTSSGGWGSRNGASNVAASTVAAPKKSGGILGDLENVVKVPAHIVAKTATGLEQKGSAFFPGIVQAGSGLAQDEASLATRFGANSDYDLAARKADPSGYAGAKRIGKAQLASIKELRHPLRDPSNTLLTGLALASGGAGTLAKAGEVGARIGVISDTSRLANLGKATDLTAPDFAKSAGQDGEDVIIKRSSAKPLRKGAQVLMNKGKNALPEQTPILGSAARVTKALAKPGVKAAARMTIDQQPFAQAFDKLTSAEKSAWHLKAQQVHPDTYKAWLTDNHEANITKAQTALDKANTPTKVQRAQESIAHIKANPPSPGMIKDLSNPKVKAAFENPSPRLQTALNEGRILADHLGTMKVDAGHISETSAAESPYRLLRLVNGAEVKSLTDENAARLGGQDAAIDKGHLGYVDKPGREIPALAKELADKGEEQPFYVPHSAETKGSAVYRNKPPGGFAAPPVSGSSKQNLGILASKGKLAFQENPLLREWTKMRGHVEAQQLHEALVDHAASLPKGQPLPHGYDYLKINRGEASAPYTEQVGTKFERGLDPKFVDKTFTQDPEDPDIRESDDGKGHLVVPSEVKKIVGDRVVKTPGKLYRLLYQQPSSLWKHLIVGLSPKSAVNISVGNSILGAMQGAPGHGLAAWVNQVTKGARLSKVSDATMNDVFPEQKLGTFGRSESGTNRGFISRAAHNKAPRTMNAASKLYQGVMPATIAYENVLRRAMVEGWAKHDPVVQAATKARGGDINAGLHDVAKTHPQIINEISKKTDDALGDYHSYNAIERQIKQLIPFYGWDRHVVRSMGRIIGEHPARAAAVANIGKQGEQYRDKTLGQVPSFGQGWIKLPGLPKEMGALNGRTPILDTGSLDPFSTASDLLGLLGKNGSSEIASEINPFIQGGIQQLTGSSLLTGAPLPKSAVGQNVPDKIWKAIAGTATGVPQVTLAKAAMEGPQSKPAGLYQNDWQSLLAAFLGAKIKKTNLDVAHGEARRGR